MTGVANKMACAAFGLALWGIVACGDSVKPEDACDSEDRLGCACEDDDDCTGGAQCTAGECVGGDQSTPVLRPANGGTRSAGEQSGDAGSMAADGGQDGGQNAGQDAGQTGGADAGGPADSGAAPAPSGICAANAGNFVCEEAVLHECDASGAEVRSETCDSERLCQQGLAAGTCPSCEPGTFRCQDAQLQVCANDGLSYTNQELCASIALCNAQLGACTDATCLPTTRICEGNNLMRCNADQDGFELDQTCGSGLCDMAAGECDVCFAGTPECDAGGRRVCDSNGQGYTAAPCTGATSICTGSGSCVACTVDGDCTQPQNECRRARCQAGSCVTSNRAQETACTSNGSVCDGAGNCVECNFNVDCNGGFCSGNSCVQCLSEANCSAGVCQSASCNSGTCAVSPTDGNDCGSGMVCNSGTCQTACGNGRVDTGITPPEQCDPTASPFSWYNCDPTTCRSRTYYTVCSVDENCDGNCLNESNAQAYICAPPCQGSDPSLCPSFPGQGSRTDNGGANSWLTCVNGDCAIFCRPQCFGNGTCDWAGAECPPQLRCTQVVGDVGLCTRP